MKIKKRNTGKNKKNYEKARRGTDYKCIELLKKYNINTIKDFRKFSLKYHPDRNMDKTPEERQILSNIFKEVSNCVDIQLKGKGYGGIYTDYTNENDEMLDELCSLNIKRLRQIARRMKIKNCNNLSKEMILRKILGIN